MCLLIRNMKLLTAVSMLLSISTMTLELSENIILTWMVSLLIQVKLMEIVICSFIIWFAAVHIAFHCISNFL